MSELDDLPSWAGRSTEEVQLPDGPQEEAPIDEDAVPEPPALPVDDSPEVDDDPETPDGPEIAAPTAAAQVPEAEPASLLTEPNDAAGPSEAAELSQAAGAAAPAVAPIAEPVASPRRRSRLRAVLLGLLGIGILAAAAIGGYALASQDSDATEASGTDATEDADQADEADGEGAATDGEATEGDAATDADATATDGGGDESTEGEDGSSTVTVTVDDEEGAESDGSDAAAGDGEDGDASPNDGDRQAIFRDGKVYLSGAVPSEEIGDVIVAKAEAVVGPGNVVNEYVIDPSTTIEPGDSAPLYVEDVVLFEFNSIAIAPPFLPILDLGTLLLRQNPQASVTVVTRTDAVGSEEVNLEVASSRAQAVINYWLGAGVDPDQIIADPRGEEGASEDDDAETAALQRRAEFIITGLLD